MNSNNLLERVKTLKLHGLVSHWDDVCGTDWIVTMIEWEEQERTHRSLERRLRNSRIGRFKALSEFDWDWPKQCDRQAIAACMQLSFINDATNIIISGPNGVGKTTIACNIAHHAVLQGYQVLLTTAGQMLNELAASDGDNALRRKIKQYTQPHLLVIDEVGYLSYSNRHADLMFEIISRRYQEKPTIVTTNKPFSEWGEIFPNASCVVSLIDRLVHHSEIITIEADSYRLKEAKEKNKQRQQARDKGNKTNRYELIRG
jgi:DNA replication protein DnaC